MTRKQLEAKYGVKISKTEVIEYEIVTMDGVHWCDGMETIEDVAQVLQESSTIFQVLNANQKTALANGANIMKLVEIRIGQNHVKGKRRDFKE